MIDNQLVFNIAGAATLHIHLVHKFIIFIILWIFGKIFRAIFKFSDPQLCFRIFPRNYSLVPFPIIK